MFVAITLVTGTRVRRPDVGIAAFSTPTIVHFCVALAVAAILSAPWQVLWHAGLSLGLIGLGGLAYSAVVVRRIRLAEYQPVLEDWSWHVAFPLVSYVAFVVAAVLLPGNPSAILFLVGAATVLLLFIGIHNAWDNIAYIVVDQIRPPVEDPDESRRVSVPSGGHAHASREGEGASTTTASLTGAPPDLGT
jgi:hypothetical protein